MKPYGSVHGMLMNEINAMVCKYDKSCSFITSNFNFIVVYNNIDQSNPCSMQGAGYENQTFCNYKMKCKESYLKLPTLRERGLEGAP